TERRPIDICDEIPACACQDYDLVRSILRNPVKGLDKFRVRMCGHNARAAVGVELNNQHTVVVSRQLYVLIGSEVVGLKRLHSVLLSFILFVGVNRRRAYQWDAAQSTS
ncbi:MAG TPA: hypothetical protein VGH08_01505, partial [Chthoniobacterales bacterium]